MEDIYQQEFDSSFKEALKKGSYEECTFKQIDLSTQDLSEFKFISCEFVECNLSNAKLLDTSIQECEFHNSKLLGLQFEDCKDFNFGASFKDCQLNHATFFQLNLSNSSFNACELHEVEFAEADMSSIALKNCDLLNANFDRTNLEKADFSGSINITIDPEINQIRGAKIPADQLIGLLAKYGVEVV